MDFSANERAHYDEVVEETEETSEYEGEGFILHKIQRLQMACNHPSLQDSRNKERQRREACDSSTWQCSLCGKPAAYRFSCSHLICMDCLVRPCSAGRWLFVLLDPAHAYCPLHARCPLHDHAQDVYVDKNGVRRPFELRDTVT